MSGYQARDLARPMTVRLRPMPAGVKGHVTLTVCVNIRPDNGISVSCGPRGGDALHEALAAEIAARGLDIELATIQCLGLCQRGPNVRLAPGNSWFHGAHAADAPALIDHVLNHLNDAALE